MTQPEVLVPETIDELKDMLLNKGCRLLAGGTDLLIELGKRGETAGTIIDLSSLDQLRKIELQENWITIGALTTFSEIENSQILYENSRCLWEAARRIGSAQIRNMATIGGNVANAAPAADGTCALLALEAQVLVTDGKEERWFTLDRYLDSRLEPASPRNEAILSSRIPRKQAGCRSAFAKLGNRSTVTISRLILACVLNTDENDTIQWARLVLGAVGPRSFYDKTTSDWLIGKKCSPALKDGLWEKLAQRIEDAIPGRASLPYKRIAIAGLVDDILKTI